jgi:hypothetical protein
MSRHSYIRRSGWTVLKKLSDLEIMVEIGKQSYTTLHSALLNGLVNHIEADFIRRAMERIMREEGDI